MKNCIRIAILSYRDLLKNPDFFPYSNQNINFIFLKEQYHSKNFIFSKTGCKFIFSKFQRTPASTHQSQYYDILFALANDFSKIRWHISKNHAKSHRNQIGKKYKKHTLQSYLNALSVLFFILKVNPHFLPKLYLISVCFAKKAHRESKPVQKPCTASLKYATLKKQN